MATTQIITSIAPVFIWSAPLNVYSRALITNKTHATSFEDMRRTADSLCVHWRDMVKAFWHCEGYVATANGVNALRFTASNGDECFLY